MSNSVVGIARNPVHLDVFYVAGDGRMYSAWWHDGSPWSNVFPIGGFFPVGAPVSAVARTPEQLDLFVVGNDGRVYTSWWTGGVSDWSGINDNWRSIGGFFPVGAPVSAVARTPEQLDLFVVGNDGQVYTSWWTGGVSDWSGINDNWFLLELIGTNFTFDPAITRDQINTLLERHRFAHSRILVCGNLSDPERQSLRQTYRRAIHHGIETSANVNASAVVGSSQVNVNFGVLFPQGTVEIAQTLIHEMMHCAGFTHPNRRNVPAGMSCAAPNPALFDCPFDGGQYYGTPPLRAELCIAGNQSDVMMLVRQKAAEDSCIIDESGRASIHRADQG